MTQSVIDSYGPTRPEIGLVFVGGAPRSGTTLVQRLLGAHSQIYAGPEFDFVPRIANLRRDMIASVRNGRISAIVDEAVIDAAMRVFLNTIFNVKAAREGASVFSEKTPSNLLESSTLLELFPHARFVFVLRDPRGIAASMKEVAQRYREKGKCPPTYCKNVLASANEINRYWDEGFQALRSAPERVLTVHYEDVVSNPWDEACRLCNFIGLPEEKGMEKIEDSHFEATETGISGWYTKEQLSEGIKNHSIQKHLRILSRYEQELVARVIHPHPVISRYNLLPERNRVGGAMLLRVYQARWRLGAAKWRALRYLGVA